MGNVYSITKNETKLITNRLIVKEIDSQFLRI